MAKEAASVREGIVGGQSQRPALGIKPGCLLVDLAAGFDLGIAERLIRRAPQAQNGRDDAGGGLTEPSQ